MAPRVSALREDFEADKRCSGGSGAPVSIQQGSAIVPLPRRKNGVFAKFGLEYAALQQQASRTRQAWLGRRWGLGFQVRLRVGRF
jgi:hypothetical protein